MSTAVLKKLPADGSNCQKNGSDELATTIMENDKAIKRKRRQAEKNMKKKLRATPSPEAMDLKVKVPQNDYPALTLSLLKEETKMNTDDNCWNKASEGRMSSFGSAEYVDACAPLCSPETQMQTKEITAPVYSKDLTKRDQTCEISSNLAPADTKNHPDQDIPAGQNLSSSDEVSLKNESFLSPIMDNAPIEESDEKSKSITTDHANLVNKVSRQLEAHARRYAAMGPPRARRGRRRAGTVTPPRSFESDTMRYNALTYDDEIASSREHKQQTHEKKGADGFTIVTDGDESDDDGIQPGHHSGTSNRSFNVRWACEKIPGKDTNSIPPISDTKLITDVVSKLQKLVAMNAFTSNDDCQLTAAVTGFCMSTSPYDPDIADKALNLMSMCHPLGREFYKYRCALFPNKSSIDQPADLKYPPILVNQLFEGKSDSKESVRGFRIFVFNYLRNLMDMVDAATNCYLLDHEAQFLSSSMNSWFYGVLGYQ
eukprot:CAMPEP_0197830178 /NCGR_PEP_ID=MMETSP1437-20131217/6779_1 /TAXON_ID=49252 ORGANISM="Eucampia antarctica, Strain CCMP1452" /NCGR_SAMPLE_ID=MMETSP1437 /ASSEMBLY_ACC=CAM_ASM_001096 /LENGTH=484 /DNA_ID=CAMNT_0043432389 /DNA_START=685 /DNA_END=2139 /DNA_ORIENTATION=-